MVLNNRLARVSLVLIVVALLGIFVRKVPVISALLLLVAPLAFVVGVSGLITSFIPAQPIYIRVIAFALLLPVIGLNIRIPVLLQPLAQSVSSVPPRALELTVDDWIQLESNDKELAARLRPLAAPDATCSDWCMKIDGFRMPLPHVEDVYWRESPEESLLQKGVSLSGVGKPKAYLRVVTQSSGVRRQTIEIELLDAGRRRLGFAVEEFRTGLPMEPADGGDATGLDYLLHSNPIASIAARFVANSEPYPVHRFVNRSLAVNHGDTSGIRTVTLETNVNVPVPAYSAERSGKPYEDLIAPFRKKRDECTSVFEYDLLDERRWAAAIYGEPSIRESFLPIIFARDRAGNLFGFRTAQTVSVRCDGGSIYAMTENTGRATRIVRYDYRGAANTSITVKLENPRNMLSYIDLGSLTLSTNAVSFTRWYWTLHPLKFVKRQDIVLTIPN